MNWGMFYDNIHIQYTKWRAANKVQDQARPQEWPVGERFRGMGPLQNVQIYISSLSLS